MVLYFKIYRAYRYVDCDVLAWGSQNGVYTLHTVYTQCKVLPGTTTDDHFFGRWRFFTRKFRMYPLYRNPDYATVTIHCFLLSKKSPS